MAALTIIGSSLDQTTCLCSCHSRGSKFCDSCSAFHGFSMENEVKWKNNFCNHGE